MAIFGIKKELKLNKFEFVRPVHVRNLVGRVGFAAMPAGTYTGDNEAELEGTKLQTLQYGYRMVNEEIENSEDKQE